MKFIGEENFKHQNRQKIGILICNLGTPESYQTKDVRKFLRQFLSDGRVIEIPKIIWWFILNGIILTLRPSKSAKLYKSVWTKEGSPLLVFSKKLIEKLKLVTNDDCEVELAERVTEFVNGIPTIKQEADFVCDHCGHHNDRVLKGMDDFF